MKEVPADPVVVDDPAADDPDELAAIKESLRGLIKTGQPYEQFGWRKARPAR